MKTVAEILASVGLRAKEAQIAELEKLLQPRKQQKKTKTYVFVSDEFGAKTPNQMKMTVLAIKGVGGPVTIKDWADRLAKVDGFQTRQPIERIILFYKKRMLEEGLVKEA